MKARFKNFCPLIDDVPSEAAAISQQLNERGFPFIIRPVLPAQTTAETYNRVRKAHPAAAIIDFCLLDRPLVNAETLAARLVRQNIPTVFVTKDRNVVDEGPRIVTGLNIPVYHKQRLIADSEYFKQCIQQLGWNSPIEARPMEPRPQPSFRERLAELQDKRLLKSLTRSEIEEVKILVARVELEEEEEADRVRKSQEGVCREVHEITNLIRQVTRELKTR